MNNNRLNQGVIGINSIGVGTVTRKMVGKRAMELAVIDGRSIHEVNRTDWDQAKRELTGQSEADPVEEILEAAPESERWDSLPGSTGHINPVSLEENNDEDGKSEGALLVEEGMREAGHDQMLQSALSRSSGDNMGSTPHR